MCGIFGLIVKENTKIDTKHIQLILEKIAKLSIARGKDSSGICFKNNYSNTIDIIKGDIPVYNLLKSQEYLKLISKSLKEYTSGSAFQAIGHARLVTNGSQLLEQNNQPILKGNIIGIHNGIIVNDKELWNENKKIKREYEIDTEVLLALIEYNLLINNSLIESICSATNKMEGTVSTALMFLNRPEIVLITNNGSLYYIHNSNYFIFASEEYFLKQLCKHAKLNDSIKHLDANQGIVVNPEKLTYEYFELNKKIKTTLENKLHSEYSVSKINLKGQFDKEVVIDPTIFINKNKESHLLQYLENNELKIKKLKRCTKCILPETFPYIEYDTNGICNYCNNYKSKVQIQSFDKLKELILPYKSKTGEADCIVPFSGGRDSTYSLHIIKKELGLNPIAFTYDWGMVTDLARRNIARVCGKLGVENIIVSANINWKRDNIRKNIIAWLKKPQLGMIPLFMAGDKYFFYYCARVKKQTGIKLNIWGINHLENTNFKIGFANVPPTYNKKRIYSISGLKQLKLFGYVGKNMLLNPAYINQSVLDTLGSFAVRYWSPKTHYFHLFDFYKWDEIELNKIIKEEYKWETAIDTKSTWRIGDGTASFYNYVYNTVAGFTENDTFRSNQIREGLITREEALTKIYEENYVRYETLRWYLEILNLDFREVITVINDIEKLYK
ncbi:MAG: hypothetical protein IPM51_11560 [Sphingobacteriaceae bacterium]|nr:hypothetical protein [Sphingobacteriaceae bacterium]